jgi:hypothetical protein
MEKKQDDFYATVSAITRFIETADSDVSPKKDKGMGASPPNPHSLFEKSEAKTLT